jgi:ribonuclease P protein component
LAALHEKDLSTTQSTTRQNARLFGADGDAGRTQDPQAAAREGPRASRDHDSGEAARLAAQARYLGFSAADRLHRRGDFLRAQRDGRRRQTPHFVIYLLSATTESDAPEASNGMAARLGVTVSRRIGGAVVRNRVKRRIRECFRRELRTLLPPGSDLVVIARTGAGELDTAAIRDELDAAVRKVATSRTPQ